MIDGLAGTSVEAACSCYEPYPSVLYSLITIDIVINLTIILRLATRDIKGNKTTKIIWRELTSIRWSWLCRKRYQISLFSILYYNCDIYICDLTYVSAALTIVMIVVIFKIITRYCLYPLFPAFSICFV